jgi:hypothetical protein
MNNPGNSQWIVYLPIFGGRRAKFPETTVDFSEWGCDLNRLQRVGGGYGFIHRLLLKHMAGRRPT